MPVIGGQMSVWAIDTDPYNRLTIDVDVDVDRCPSSFVPSAITRSFFELQTSDFAWKFVWTVPTNNPK